MPLHFAKFLINHHVVNPFARRGAELLPDSVQFAIVLPLIYPVYLVWLMTQGFAIFAFVMLASWIAYTALSILPLFLVPRITRRVDRMSSLIPAALMITVHREVLRWVKVRALCMEILHIRYEDSFLPDSAWAHVRRY